MTPFAKTNRVTSRFGYREYWYNGKLVKENHWGKDLVATTTPGASIPEDEWIVRECTGGKVIKVAYDQWRGNYIDVQTAPGVFERYQHMKTIYKKVGDDVPQGTHLGVAGSTGQSTGVHLHFEVQVNGKAVEPSAWSGIPNKVGTYAGNNNYDEGQEPEILEIPKTEIFDKKANGKLLAEYNINVRSAPNTDSEIIGMFAKGDIVEFFEQNGDWSRVQIDNQNGWIKSEPYAEKV